MKKVKFQKLNKNTKSIMYKTFFFVFLLIVIAMLYMESRALIDAVYFMVVLTIFIRFIILKLYHL